MKDIFTVELKYKTIAKVNLRRAFGKIADKHPLGTSSENIENKPDPVPESWRRAGVYFFPNGGRKFDGAEKFISDERIAINANKLFRHIDKHLKRLDKKYHRIYDHGRFDDVEMEIIVCPDGTVEISLYDVIDALIERLSDDNGEEEQIKEGLDVLKQLLMRC